MRVKKYLMMKVYYQR